MVTNYSNTYRSVGDKSNLVNSVFFDKTNSNLSYPETAFSLLSISLLENIRCKIFCCCYDFELVRLLLC